MNAANRRRSDDDESIPVDSLGVWFHKSFSIGNIVAILVFIISIAVQWAMTQSTLATHEERIRALEQIVQNNDRELVRRGTIQDRVLIILQDNAAKLDRIEGKIDRHIEMHGKR